MWPLSKSTRDKIRTEELGYMRRCINATRMDKLRTEEI